MNEFEEIKRGGYIPHKDYNKLTDKMEELCEFETNVKQGKMPDITRFQCHAKFEGLLPFSIVFASQLKASIVNKRITQFEIGAFSATQDGRPFLPLTNSAKDIPVGAWGSLEPVSLYRPLPFRYDSEDAPDFNNPCGVVPGSFRLGKSYSGFLAVSEPFRLNNQNVIMAILMPEHSIVGTVTTEVTAYNSTDKIFGTGKFSPVIRNPDDNKAIALTNNDIDVYNLDTSAHTVGSIVKAESTVGVGYVLDKSGGTGPDSPDCTDCCTDCVEVTLDFSNWSNHTVLSDTCDGADIECDNLGTQQVQLIKNNATGYPTGQTPGSGLCYWSMPTPIEICKANDAGSQSDMQIRVHAELNESDCTIQLYVNLCQSDGTATLAVGSWFYRTDESLCGESYVVQFVGSEQSTVTAASVPAPCGADSTFKPPKIEFSNCTECNDCIPLSSTDFDMTATFNSDGTLADGECDQCNELWSGVNVLTKSDGCVWEYLDEDVCDTINLRVGTLLSSDYIIRATISAVNLTQCKWLVDVIIAPEGEQNAVHTRYESSAIAHASMTTFPIVCTKTGHSNNSRDGESPGCTGTAPTTVTLNASGMLPPP